MALVPLQSSYFISTTKLTPDHLFKSLTNFPTKTKLIITSQDTSSSSSSSKPTIEQASTSSNAKPATSSGQGFGSAAAETSTKGGNQEAGKKNKGKKKERATIVRRSPVGTPAFTTDSNKRYDDDDDKVLNSNDQDQSQNESAFLLAWLALGSLILVEGIALAASGFLPQEWDKFFVKFLYPSFTPTVFLFVAGTVVYGVFKYLQNESLRNQK